MSKQVRIRRGTTVQHASFTGADGEITYDSTLRVLRLHDGATPGGKVLRDPLLLNDPASDLQVVQTGGVEFAGADGDGISLSAVGIALFYGALASKAALIVEKSFVRTPAALTYAASVAINFGTECFKTLTLAGNLTLTSSGLVAGASVLLAITCDASLRSLTFPAWKFIGSAAPATIAANKTGLLELYSQSTSDALVIARWAVEP